MRAYRIFTMLALLASIGSFVVELWSATKPDEKSEGSRGGSSGPSPQAKGGRPAIREAASLDQAGCELQIYEPIRSKLRSEASQSQAGEAGRFQRIAEERGFVYIYDRVEDKLLCAVRTEPADQVVFSSQPDGVERRRNEIVSWCVMVIILATLGLIAIHAGRLRQSYD